MSWKLILTDTVQAVGSNLDLTSKTKPNVISMFIVIGVGGGAIH